MSKHEHPRIRLVFFSFGILEQGGGFENYLLATARGLADRYQDLDISIVTMSPEIVERLQHLLTIYFMRVQKPQAIYRETYESVRAKLGNITYTRASSFTELARLLKHADLIYSKNEVLELAVLNRIGLRKLPPIVLGVHTPIYYPNTPSVSARLHNLIYTGPLYRRLIKDVQSVQVNNQDDLELVRRKLKFANTRVMRQAFEVPPLKHFAVKPGKLKILFVGRLTEAKGIDLLTSTIELLERECPGSFCVRIAGSGDASIVADVQRLARNIPVVEYLGHVQNDRVSELYDWADVTVITSNYETLNKVAIETAMAGKIAVCTDIPGPREIVQNHVTGFLLPPNPQAFVSCLSELSQLKANNPTALQRMGFAAYDYIKRKFDADEVYKDMYQEIVHIARRSQNVAA